MRRTDVRVPAALLLDPQLTVHAKVVWMLGCLNSHGYRSKLEYRSHVESRNEFEAVPHQEARSGSKTRLAERGGFSRVTVRTALRQLAAAGWSHDGAGLPHAAAGLPHAGASDWARQAQYGLPSPMARLPAELLQDAFIGARARVLYGVLQLVPDFRHPSGWLIPADLAERLQVQAETVRRAVRELTGTGWLRTERPQRRTPLRFTLCDPIAEAHQRAVLVVQRRVETAPYRGEALMRAYLDLLVALDEFEDDAEPGFLVNPQSGERLQFDRFYPPKVAFEFNGPQHYGATERFPDATVREQRFRDLIKLGICVERGITLIVVRPENLNVESIRQLIGGQLPSRSLHGRDAVVEYLEAAGRRYLSTAPSVSASV